MEVEVKSPKGKVYSLLINDLFESILPDQSFTKVISYHLNMHVCTFLPLEYACLHDLVSLLCIAEMS